MFRPSKKAVALVAGMTLASTLLVAAPANAVYAACGAWREEKDVFGPNVYRAVVTCSRIDSDTKVRASLCATWARTTRVAGSRRNRVRAHRLVDLLLRVPRHVRGGEALGVVPPVTPTQECGAGRDAGGNRHGYRHPVGIVCVRRRECDPPGAARPRGQQ